MKESNNSRALHGNPHSESIARHTQNRPLRIRAYWELFLYEVKKNRKINIFENKITKLLRSKVLGKFTSIDNRDVSKILIEF